MEPRRASDSASILVRWMAITDANSGGFVHGGAVMKLCDEAAGLAAIKHSGHRAVTAAMDRMTFLHPVYVGELLTCSAVRQRGLADLDGGRRPDRGREPDHRASAATRAPRT